jgi:hypothetical protein
MSWPNDRIPVPTAVEIKHHISISAAVEADFMDSRIWPVLPASNHSGLHIEAMLLAGSANGFACSGQFDEMSMPLGDSASISQECHCEDLFYEPVLTSCGDPYFGKVEEEMCDCVSPSAIFHGTVRDEKSLELHSPVEINAPRSPIFSHSVRDLLSWLAMISAIPAAYKEARSESQEVWPAHVEIGCLKCKVP